MSNSRQDFKHIESNIDRKKGEKAFEGFLRLESADLGTQKSIDFFVSRDSANQAATETEVRLAKTDSFVVTALGFALMKTVTSGACAIAKLHSFPNPLIFGGTNEANNLRQIYNGSLYVSVDGAVVVPSFPTLKFLRVGQAQDTVLTAASGTGNAYGASQWDSNTFPYYPLKSYLTFNGASNIEIKINCPSSKDMAATGGSGYNKAVLLLWGTLIQNAARYNA